MGNNCGCYTFRRKDLGKEIYIANPSILDKQKMAGLIILKYYQKYKEYKSKNEIAIKEFDRFLKGLKEIKSSVQIVEVISLGFIQKNWRIYI